MGQVTVEEPKTVVDEVTRYECDKCGYVGEEDEMNQYKIFSDTNVHKESGHLCDECVESERYVTYMDLQRDKQRIGEAISWGFNRLDYLAGAAVSTGMYLGYQYIITLDGPNIVMKWGIAEGIVFFIMAVIFAVIALFSMILLSLYLGVDTEQ